ncbi:helix-turn-helix domain-containing protein [Sphingomonas sp. IC-56]|uniref:transcriptional regulator n=1 Tax=Sphingomonas sp. IC-56 TaxID=2898529 RepID=UPI001E4D490F|nr:YdaS family helix-turn-helix protein [Sphingomonas sp. IC-56]MCD2325319.1 helix-turn-helix domain-containing protein [Sphingomonas sp. IC-56]
MPIHSRPETPLARAVRAMGSQSSFGRLIGRRQSTVFGWLKDAKLLPAEHVLLVERATGVSRHDLRPDIYPLDTTVTGSLPLSHNGGDVANGAPMVAFNRGAVLPFEVGND